MSVLSQIWRQTIPNMPTHNSKYSITNYIAWHVSPNCTVHIHISNWSNHFIIRLLLKRHKIYQIQTEITDHFLTGQREQRFFPQESQDWSCSAQYDWDALDTWNSPTWTQPNLLNCDRGFSGRQSQQSSVAAASTETLYTVLTNSTFATASTRSHDIHLHHFNICNSINSLPRYTSAPLQHLQQHQLAPTIYICTSVIT